MRFALSTSWFAEPASGDEVVDKALELGFDGLEIGYRLGAALVPAIAARVGKGEIAVQSVHAFGPVPEDVKAGHPELHHIADTDEDKRKLAVEKVLGVLESARSIGALAVVLHAGRVKEVFAPWAWVHGRIAAERARGLVFRIRRKRMEALRAQLLPTYMDALRKSLDELLPSFSGAGVDLCLENLPSWDAIPQPDEAATLMRDYSGSALRCWYDIGHGQVMENAGKGTMAGAARDLADYIRGVHIHDVCGPAGDHQAPGMGGIDFASVSFFAGPQYIRVFEPAAGIPPQDLASGLALLKRIWPDEQISPGQRP